MTSLETLCQKMAATQEAIDRLQDEKRSLSVKIAQAEFEARRNEILCAASTACPDLLWRVRLHWSDLLGDRVKSEVTLAFAWLRGGDEDVPDDGVRLKLNVYQLLPKLHFEDRFASVVSAEFPRDQDFILCRCEGATAEDAIAKTLSSLSNFSIALSDYISQLETSAQKDADLARQLASDLRLELRTTAIGYRYRIFGLLSRSSDPVKEAALIMLSPEERKDLWDLQRKAP